MYIYMHVHICIYMYICTYTSYHIHHYTWFASRHIHIVRPHTTTILQHQSRKDQNHDTHMWRDSFMDGSCHTRALATVRAALHRKCTCEGVFIVVTTLCSRWTWPSYIISMWSGPKSWPDGLYGLAFALFSQQCFYTLVCTLTSPRSSSTTHTYMYVCIYVCVCIYTYACIYNYRTTTTVWLPPPPQYVYAIICI